MNNICAYGGTLLRTLKWVYYGGYKKWGFFREILGNYRIVFSLPKSIRFWFFQMNHEHRARVGSRNALHVVGVTPVLHVVRSCALL